MSPIVIGVDPGSRWSAAIARAGDQPLDGFTIGPPTRRPLRSCDPGDPAGVQAYVERLGTRLDAMFDACEAVYGPVLVAVELPTLPKGYRRIPLRDWLATSHIAWALVGRYAGVQLVPAGVAPTPKTWPPELTGRRPAHWRPNEHPQGRRDHEQSAYVIAGVGLARIHERTAA